VLANSGVICGLGDILSQAFAVGGLGALRHVFDLQRMIVYGLIGGFYLAPLVHYWFAVLEKVTAKKGKVTDSILRAVIAFVSLFSFDLS
jgi:TctA family transporter